MRVLWVCNIMPAIFSAKLGRRSSNKEGWIEGLLEAIWKNKKGEAFSLGLAFPMEEQAGMLNTTFSIHSMAITCYGFYEDPQAHIYTPGLEERMEAIIRDFSPDIVHCFGTEYGHTLAAARVWKRPNRLLIGIQGLCGVYAKAYMADLPRRVIRRRTLRDVLRRDGLLLQQERYRLRGEMEREAISLCGHVAGRTHWDKRYSQIYQPRAVYHHLGESLRPCFYEEQWSREKAIPYRIFLSQGDYPIKGLHYALLALPRIQQAYPQAHLAVAGAPLVKLGDLANSLKRGSYAKYLAYLIKKVSIKTQRGISGQADSSGDAAGLPGQQRIPLPLLHREFPQFPGGGHAAGHALRGSQGGRRGEHDAPRSGGPAL